MGRIRDLLLALAAGESLAGAWRRAAYGSVEEAGRALRELAGTLGDKGGGEAKRRIEREGAPLSVIVYVDGASRGNPGPSSVGAVARLPEGEELTSISMAIGRATNNVAEYRAVLEGLRLASALNASEVEIRLDSELVARQLNGEYRIKDGKLQVISRTVKEEAVRFDTCRYVHIPRTENAEADRLANEALDRKAADT